MKEAFLGIDEKRAAVLMPLKDECWQPIRLAKALLARNLVTLALRKLIDKTEPRVKCWLEMRLLKVSVAVDHLTANALMRLKVLV